MKQVRVDFYYADGHALNLKPSSVVVEIDDISDESKIISLAKEEARRTQGINEIFKASFALL